MIETEQANGHASMLHNSGGPRSRVRTELIDSNLLAENGMSISLGLIGVSVPDEVSDVEAWLRNTLHITSEWNEVSRQCRLPDKRLMVFTEQEPGKPYQLDGTDLLHAVLILSKCSQHSYNPDSPFIFTKKRINRSIRLLEINYHAFYEMD